MSNSIEYNTKLKEIEEAMCYLEREGYKYSKEWKRYQVERRDLLKEQRMWN